MPHPICSKISFKTRFYTITSVKVVLQTKLATLAADRCSTSYVDHLLSLFNMAYQTGTRMLCCAHFLCLVYFRREHRRVRVTDAMKLNSSVFRKLKTLWCKWPKSLNLAPLFELLRNSGDIRTSDRRTWDEKTTDNFVFCTQSPNTRCIPTENFRREQHRSGSEGLTGSLLLQSESYFEGAPGTLHGPPPRHSQPWEQHLFAI